MRTKQRPLVLQGRPRLKLSSTESENETKEREELDLGGGGSAYYGVNVLKCGIDSVDNTICSSNLNPLNERNLTNSCITRTLEVRIAPFAL